MVQYCLTRKIKLDNLLGVPSNFGGFSTVTWFLKPGAEAVVDANNYAYKVDA